MPDRRSHRMSTVGDLLVGISVETACQTHERVRAVKLKAKYYAIQVADQICDLVADLVACHRLGLGPGRRSGRRPVASWNAQERPFMNIRLKFRYHHSIP